MKRVPTSMPVLSAAEPSAPGGEAALPEWDLTALYAAPDDPAVTADLDRAIDLADAFSDRAKGRLAAIVAAPEGGRQLAAIIADYEALQDLMGRLMSYAGLLYSGNTTDPVRAKFFGDVQEKITNIS